MTDTDSTAIKTVATDVDTDVVLAINIIKALKSGDKAGALAQAETAIPLVSKQVQDFKAVMPVVKAGYKTTEFWITVAFLGLNAYKPLPMDVNAVIGTVVGIYTVVRGMIKHTDIVTPTTSAPATK